MDVRFHLDEHIEGAIADGVRQRRIDVTTAAEAGLLQATDEEHLAFALAESRVTVTHDDDFLSFTNAAFRTPGLRIVTYRRAQSARRSAA